MKSIKIYRILLFRDSALAAGMIETTGHHLQAKLDEYGIELEDATEETVLNDGSR